MQLLANCLEYPADLRVGSPPSDRDQVEDVGGEGGAGEGGDLAGGVVGGETSTWSPPITLMPARRVRMARASAVVGPPMTGVPVPGA